VERGVSKKIDVNAIVGDAFGKALDVIDSGVGDDDMFAREHMCKELGRRFIEAAQSLEAEREKLSTPEGRAEIIEKTERMWERAQRLARGEKVPTATERMNNLAAILSKQKDFRGWTAEEIRSALSKAAAKKDRGIQ
jgi:hypothetical protein